jgi:hypothetical protein
MAKRENQQSGSNKAPVRSSARVSVAEALTQRSPVRTTAQGRCDDCRATTAFQAWHNVDLPPSLNVEVSFADWKIVPKGARATIELVTAEILVPLGEWARLRMYTSLGSVPSNMDLFLTSQGNVGNQAIFVATHTLRAYTDNLIEFNINRDNAITNGSALICISGYIVS